LENEQQPKNNAGLWTESRAQNPNRSEQKRTRDWRPIASLAEQAIEALLSSVPSTLTAPHQFNAAYALPAPALATR